MTLRVNLAYTATAALILLIADIAAAQAATKICDVMPSRCRYNADGRNYYWTPDRHMPAYGQGPSTSVGAGAAASAATGAHNWGCGATNGTAKGRSWGFSNKAAASYRALSECSKRAPQGGCHVVSCSASVHSYDEAHVAWFANQ
jgi:hypothetical protein